MKIRKIEEQDRRAVVDLWRAVFADDPPHNEPSQALVAKLAVDDLVFVAERDGVIVGACMAGYDGHRGWLYALAVAQDQRRGGVGRALVEHCTQALKAIGCRKLNLQIRADNHAVAAFYASLGFETEARLSMGKLFDD